MYKPGNNFQQYCSNERDLHLESNKVDEFMDNLNHPYKDGIAFLRQIIKQCNENIVEEIKWNAPSYRITEHFATFKLYPPKHIQIVLHAGAKKKEHPQKFHLDDPLNLIKWAAPDRCTITIKSNEAARKVGEEISTIIKSWIKQL